MTCYRLDMTIPLSFNHGHLTLTLYNKILDAESLPLSSPPHHIFLITKTLALTPAALR